MRCEDTRCEETRCEDARCEEVRCEEMKCEETRRFNLVRRPTLGGHFRGSRGVPRRKVLAFGSKGGKSTSNRCKEDAIRMKSAKFGRNRRKSKKFRSFITEKAIFCRQTDRDISALRAGVPQISVHQNTRKTLYRPSRGSLTHEPHRAR